MKLQSELISVILPIYKEPIEWIKLSVDSILKQTYRNIELIIIIDNPQRNDVIEWLRGNTDDRIVYMSNEKNYGIVYSLNKGLKLCQGEFVARMDADDISIPTRLEKQLAYIRSRHCDIVGCNIETFCEKDSVIHTSHYPKNISSMKKYVISGRGIPHPTWFIKKEVFDKLGGYRKIDFAEDYDFLIRAIVVGYRVGCVSDCCLRYRQNLSGISQRNKGKQKYIAHIIQEQAKNGELYSEEYIYLRIAQDKKNIDMYSEYYHFSRKIRLLIKDKDIAGIVDVLKTVKIGYLGILNSDIKRSLTLKLLEMI